MVDLTAAGVALSFSLSLLTSSVSRSLTSIPHFLSLSSLRVHLPVRLDSCARLILTIEQDRCFPFHHGQCLSFGQPKEWKSEGRGEDRHRAGSSSSACSRSLTDFLTSHQYIDSRCHSGGFRDVQSSGTWGWWPAFDWLCVDLKPTAFWAGLFDGKSPCQKSCQRSPFN